jgi:hypothetical protein
VLRTLSRERRGRESYLDETNVGGLLTEALTADVEAVLADQTSRVGADAAVSTVLAMSFPFKASPVARNPITCASSPRAHQDGRIYIYISYIPLFRKIE